MQKHEPPIGHGIEDPGAQGDTHTIFWYTHGSVDGVVHIGRCRMPHILMDPGHPNHDGAQDPDELRSARLTAIARPTGALFGRTSQGWQVKDQGVPPVCQIGVGFNEVLKFTQGSSFLRGIVTLCNYNSQPLRWLISVMAKGELICDHFCMLAVGIACSVSGYQVITEVITLGGQLLIQLLNPLL